MYALAHKTRYKCIVLYKSQHLYVAGKLSFEKKILILNSAQKRSEYLGALEFLPNNTNCKKKLIIKKMSLLKYVT